MFNPLLESMSELTDEQLLGKITELHTKMRQASMSGMHTSITQMNVILFEYQEEMNRRHIKSLEDGKEAYDDLIDVNKNT
tara:strand:- start:411 stop:650 length:240 start_codon:yes stop_codon:yes gene_type:complete